MSRFCGCPAEGAERGSAGAGSMSSWTSAWVFLSGEELVLAAKGKSGLLRLRFFRNNLDVEHLRFRGEAGNLLTCWPIINFGIRYGL